MKLNQKTLRKLSPGQLFVVGVILIVAALYQVLAPAPEPPTQPEPAAPSIQVSKSPVVPSERPSASPQASTVVTTSPKNTATAKATTAGFNTGTMSSFDYFVLALSWSPDYCATSGGDDPQQCSIGKKLGFVLHGLWPQNNQGYPSDCTTEKMPQSVKSQFVGLYPNDALFDHEWEKHGTCTGLSPAQFLALSQQIKNSVVIPAAFRAPDTAFRTTSEQIRKDFAQANPGFNPAAFEANCSGSGRYFKELYVCFSRSGSSIACGSEVHKEALKSCQAADFLVRNTR